MITKENIVLGEGGEILSADITTIKKVTAEQFCQIYLEDNADFYKLTKAESNVLAVCWYTSTYYEDNKELPGNKVYCDKSFIDLCIRKTDLKQSTIKNALSSLVKKNMIWKDKDYKSIYYLNPKLFFKGRLSDRTKVIKHYIEYQIENQ